MRSCLVQLLVLVGLAFGLLWFGLPIGASWLATNALNASGFSGTGTKVEVSASPPLRLLTGQADSIRVTSNQVSVGDLHAASLDLTFGQVDLISRRIDTVEGQLVQVRVSSPSGDTVTIDGVSLSGPASDSTARLTLSMSEAQTLAQNELAAHGIPGSVRLSVPDKVTIRAAAQSISAHLAVLDGSLILIPTDTQVAPITLLAPGSGNPFHVTAVAITATGGAILTGTIDVQSLLGL